VVELVGYAGVRIQRPRDPSLGATSLPEKARRGSPARPRARDSGLIAIGHSREKRRDPDVDVIKWLLAVHDGWHRLSIVSTVRPAQEASGSLRARKKDRTRRMIQAEALRLFAEQGFGATTVEQIAAAADVAPRTFFRYFPTKDEVVFWSEYEPLLAGFVEARPADEPAVVAVSQALVDGLAAFYEQDRDLVLDRLKLAFGTPALYPRLWRQQARTAVGVGRLLAGRLDARPDDLEIRAIAAAIAAALWVAVEEWQAHDGQQELAVLIDRALGTVLAGAVPATEAAVEPWKGR
jgi:AcrR family transcriptional regulator